MLLFAILLGAVMTTMFVIEVFVAELYDGPGKGVVVSLCCSPKQYKGCGSVLIMFSRPCLVPAPHPDRAIRRMHPSNHGRLAGHRFSSYGLGKLLRCHRP